VSQIYKSTSSGPVPPTVPTQFTADDATIAVPAGNNLNVLSRDTGQDNLNGIQTTADPNGSANLYIELTNRLTGTGTTIGASTVNLITFALDASPQAYLFNFEVVGFNSVTPAAAGFSTFTTVRTDGVTATVIDDTDSINHTDPVLTDVAVEMTSSGNTVILRATGVAGLTVNWSTVGLYVRVG
jgi:hypothetical protein